MNTLPPVNRLPYYSRTHFEAWEEAIEEALGGKVVKVYVRGSGLTELSLYTQARSVLRWAEDREGLEGAKAISVHRLGKKSSRYIELRKRASVNFEVE